MNGDEGQNPGSATSGQIVTPGTSVAPSETASRTNPVYAPPAEAAPAAPPTPAPAPAATQANVAAPAQPQPPVATVPAQPVPTSTAPNYPGGMDAFDEDIDEGMGTLYDEDGADAFGQHDPTVIEWTADEFIQHQRSFKWYAAMVGAFVFAAVVIFFLTHDKISSGTLVIIGIMLAVLGARKPRTLAYRLDGDGLKMGEKQYRFNQFRSFAPMEEHNTKSVSFYPLQRFMPLITVYFGANEEDRIVDMLSNHLPMEEREHDVIDTLLHKIKF